MAMDPVQFKLPISLFGGCSICYLAFVTSISSVFSTSFPMVCKHVNRQINQLRLYFAKKRGLHILIEQPISSASQPKAIYNFKVRGVLQYLRFCGCGLLWDDFLSGPDAGKWQFKIIEPWHWDMHIMYVKYIMNTVRYHIISYHLWIYGSMMGSLCRSQLIPLLQASGFPYGCLRSSNPEDDGVPWRDQIW